MDQSPQPAAPSSSLSDPSTDPLLCSPLDAFALESLTVGFTLTIGSTIVCGNAITEAAYIASLADEIRLGYGDIAAQAAETFAGDPQLAEGLAAISSVGEKLAASLERSGRKVTANRERRTAARAGCVISESDGADAPKPRRSIYLADVEIWTPGGGVARLPFWRARLDAVIGWSARRIVPQPVPPAPEETLQPSSATGTGAPDAATVLTQFARGFVDAYRAERERQKADRPGGINPTGPSDFAKEWARKTEQGRRVDAYGRQTPRHEICAPNSPSLAPMTLMSRQRVVERRSASLSHKIMGRKECKRLVAIEEAGFKPR